MVDTLLTCFNNSNQAKHFSGDRIRGRIHLTDSCIIPEELQPSFLHFRLKKYYACTELLFFLKLNNDASFSEIIAEKFFMSSRDDGLLLSNNL